MASANHAFGVRANPPVASWSTGLCGCCDDVGSCCLTFFCPCVTFGRIAEIVDQGATSCCASGTLYLALAMATGLGCLYSCCYRSKLRAQYGLKEKPCADCCVHWCCEPCALSQEYRELKRRGFDMTVGWHANMEMGKGAATVAPQMHPGMTRLMSACAECMQAGYVHDQYCQLPSPSTSVLSRLVSSYSVLCSPVGRCNV